LGEVRLDRCLETSLAAAADSHRLHPTRPLSCQPTAQLTLSLGRSRAHAPCPSSLEPRCESVNFV